MMDIDFYDEPMPAVGIFWYNREEHDLFGVYKKELSPRMMEEAAEKGLPYILFQSLHRNVWQKQYMHAVTHNEPSLFMGDYDQFPRGRVSWCVDHFEVLVGSWARDIEDDLAALIRKHFALSSFEFKYDEHWN